MALDSKVNQPAALLQQRARFKYIGSSVFVSVELLQERDVGPDVSRRHTGLNGCRCPLRVRAQCNDRRVADISETEQNSFLWGNVDLIQLLLDCAVQGLRLV